MATVLALDFDGVICDSVDECLITACNAWNSLQGGSDWITTLDEVESHVAQRFRQHRYLARNAPDFWPILHWALSGDTILDESELASFRLEYAGIIKRFEPTFFEARDRYRSKDPEPWMALNRFYPEFQDGWNQLKGKYPTHIITTKDLRSIQHFNQQWKLGIPPEHLWTNEQRLSKAAIAQRIIDDSGIPPEELFFVDDHPHHLQDVATTGARCFWASWGYLGASGLSLPEPSSAVSLTRLTDLLPYLSPA
ncbi:HAD family hydrolase [Candidatus Neomarinimicrobiota bacterium]